MAKTAADLKELLMSEKVSLVELGACLIDFFNNASQVSSNEIRYGQEDSDKKLTLTYSKDYGTLESVALTPNFPEILVNELHEKIREAFFVDSPDTIGNTILFSRYPVDGYCTVGDAFQLLPAPPHAPRPRFSYADHPFLLEYKYNGSKNSSVDAIRFVNTRTELSLLLNVLLEGQIIDRHLNQLSHIWVLIKGGPSSNLRSEYLQPGYSVCGLTATREEFSGIDELDPMNSIDPDKYYVRFAIQAGRSLQVPSDLNVSIERYYALDSEHRSRFLRACYWNHQANQIFHCSRSASYISLVNAIECLMDEPESHGVCKECNREIKEGPTKMFRDFIEKYSPGVPLSIRNELYQVRSKLSHGAVLLPLDMPGLTFGLDPKYLESRNQYSMMAKVVDYTMYNWIHQFFN